MLLLGLQHKQQAAMGSEYLTRHSHWKYVRSVCLVKCMDLLQACDEMKAFIKTAQRLIEAWEKDPDNYSKLEDGLNAMKAELEKFKD